jgi:hypothetical protein
MYGAFGPDWEFAARTPRANEGTETEGAEGRTGRYEKRSAFLNWEKAALSPLSGMAGAGMCIPAWVG